MLPTFILFRLEKYELQKDLGAQLKLSVELSVVYSIGSRNSSEVSSSVAHLKAVSPQSKRRFLRSPQLY